LKALWILGGGEGGGQSLLKSYTYNEFEVLRNKIEMLISRGRKSSIARHG